MVNNYRKIASAADIEIYVEKNWDYSFHSSPYQAHRESAAVDIYPNIEFNEETLSPVEGIVTEIKKFQTPTPTQKSLPEYITMIGNRKYAARLMHLKPDVKKGEKIYVGDYIGKLIKNGFHSRWTDPGIHVEVRRAGDFIKAKGGLELTYHLSENTATLSSDRIKGEVVEVSERNITVLLEKNAAAEVCNQLFPLDGLLSIDYAGLLGTAPQEKNVYLNTTIIGQTFKKNTSSTVFHTRDLEFKIKNKRLAGVYFISEGRKIKLIPEKHREEICNRGEKIEISIETKNTLKN